MANEITVVRPTSWTEVMVMAERLAEAKGFVPASLYRNPNGIAAAILTGAELGVPPMESLRSIYLIDGRPELAADLMLKLAMLAGVRVEWTETNDAVARCKLTRDGREHVHEFTLAEAKKAGLAGKTNWQRYPAQMLRARCISGALRAWCPDAIGSGVYVAGEISEAREAEQVSTADSAPRMRLRDVASGDDLRGWIEVNRASIDERKDEARERAERAVIERGEAIGVDRETVQRWLLGDAPQQLPADVVDGDVAEEPAADPATAPEAGEEAGQ